MFVTKLPPMLGFGRTSTPLLPQFATLSRSTVLAFEPGVFNPFSHALFICMQRAGPSLFIHCFSPGPVFLHTHSKKWRVGFLLFSNSIFCMKCLSDKKTLCMPFVAHTILFHLVPRYSKSKLQILQKNFIYGLSHLIFCTCFSFTQCYLYLWHDVQKENSVESWIKALV